MRIFVAISYFILFLLNPDFSFSQTKKKSDDNKYHKIVSKSYIDKYTGNPVKLSVEEAKIAVNAMLKVVDNTNYVFQLSSYEFAYNRVGVTEDEVTGKISPTTNLVSERFKQTPLPDTWRRIITEDLQKGEELIFFDIVGIDKTGRKFLAPDIKIIVE